MIIDVVADEDKINSVKDCIGETTRKNYKKIILLSSLSMIPIYIFIYIYFPALILQYFYPVTSLFFLLILAISLLYGETFSGTLVDYRYYIIIKEGYLQVRVVSLLQTESIFSYPIDDIGGVGLNKKKMTIKCGKGKMNVEGEVIEIFNKRGRKVFDFGLWLHKEDLLKIQREIAVNIKLIKAENKEYEFS